MKEFDIAFSLSFDGEDADAHEIDFYDVSKALVGFQRTLAITTHLVLNGDVITQSPSLEGAKIIAFPPEEGSWKFWAAVGIIGTAAYNLTTAPKDTPLGHVMYSAYDYVISESLGFHVDYDKTLGELYEEHQAEVDKLPHIKQSQLDSVIEKCESGIRDMHRPLVFSKTAQEATISCSIHGKSKPIGGKLGIESYDYINYTKKGTELEKIEGFVSSYNSNTYKGRIFIPEVSRPIPFLLGDTAQNIRVVSKITNSLHLNAQDRMRRGSGLKCDVYKNYSRTGRLKSIIILNIDD